MGYEKQKKQRTREKKEDSVWSGVGGAEGKRETEMRGERCAREKAWWKKRKRE